MAAKTPDVTIPINDGNRNGVIVRFDSLDDGDTWASGYDIEPIHIDINNRTDGTVVSATFSSGTFTFTIAGAASNKDVSIKIIK